MTRKTKADLEKELLDLRKKLSACESERIMDDDIETTQTFLQQYGGYLLAAAVLVAFLYFKGNIAIDPTPTPVPPKPEVEGVVSEFFPAVKEGYKQAFVQAADRVKSGAIKTDKELFDFVQPSLVALRQEKQRPFDQMFQMSLPRNEDGSFAGHEAEVEAFLRKISESW